LGTITLVYDHVKRGLSNKLTILQNKHHDIVLATTHVHLDSHICAEMIMLKGRAKEVKEMSDLLKHQIGVIHSTLQMSSTGNRINNL